MIRIFNGKWRGPGTKENRVGMLLEFNFRKILHKFKGAKLAVFLAIALHADENGISFPSYDTLEKETGYNRASIARALKELCDSEIDGKQVLIRFRIRDEHGQFVGSNRYLVFPTDEEVQSIKSELWTVIQSSKNPTLDKPNSGKVNSKLNHIKDKPKNKEEEGEPANIYRIYESYFGTITGKMGEELKLLEEDYALYWIKDAFKIAKDNNAHSPLGYAKKVLQRMANDGNGREPEEDALTKVAKEMGL